jgi:hypothetical protein
MKRIVYLKNRAMILTLRSIINTIGTAVKILKWKPPIQESAWTGFIPSSDGQYRFFYNGGLYHGDDKVTDSRWQFGCNGSIFLRVMTSW